uniref:Oligopeptide transporter 5 n=1 Tax=Vitis vinifera TaxID=29760 RepID=F6I575_VITVI
MAEPQGDNQLKPPEMQHLDIEVTVAWLWMGWPVQKIPSGLPPICGGQQIWSKSLSSGPCMKKKKSKGGVTRLQFFVIVFISSFAYYLVPSYLFPTISAISIVCLIWKNSITAQQIGSGLSGMGLGSFGIDWSTVASFLGSPLATPGFAIINILAGFVLIMYVILPISYYRNASHAKRFPISSPHTFDSNGQKYVTRILDPKTFSIDLAGYNAYSKLYLSVFFAFTYGISFATLTAAISHVGLFHGKTIWQMWSKTRAAVGDQFGDMHTRLMKKNYKIVPQWWFFIILTILLGLAFLACEGFNKQLQLPWWGIPPCCALALFFTLPIGIITATTNQARLNVITQLIIGYVYPGKPLENATFKTYGYISMVQALTFLSDFKLGHYMKVPP